MPLKMGLENYIKAIGFVKQMSSKPIGKEIPILQTSFNKSHGVDTRFFQVLKDLKVITPEVSEIREGTIFKWIYVMPELETITNLGQRVMDHLYDLNQLKKDKRAALNTNEAKKKRAKIMYKRELKAKALKEKAQLEEAMDKTLELKLSNPSQQERANEAQLEAVFQKQQGKTGGTIRNTGNKETLVTDIKVATLPQQELPKQLSTQSKHESLSFSLSGQITKEEIFSALKVLIKDDAISSLHIEVKYH